MIESLGLVNPPLSEKTLTDWRKLPGYYARGLFRKEQWFSDGASLPKVDRNAAEPMSPFKGKTLVEVSAEQVLGRGMLLSDLRSLTVSGERIKGFFNKSIPIEGTLIAVSNHYTATVEFTNGSIMHVHEVDLVPLGLHEWVPSKLVSKFSRRPHLIQSLLLDVDCFYPATNTPYEDINPETLFPRRINDFRQNGSEVYSINGEKKVVLPQAGEYQPDIEQPRMRNVKIAIMVSFFLTAIVIGWILKPRVRR